MSGGNLQRLLSGHQVSHSNLEAPAPQSRESISL